MSIPVLPTILRRLGHAHAQSYAPPDRPVLSRERLMALCGQVLEMTTVYNATVTVKHTAQSFTRLSGGVVRTSNDGEQLTIHIDLGNHFGLTTDQLDLGRLRDLVRAYEDASRTPGEVDEVIVADQDKQDTYVPVQLWHDSTIVAMRESRATLLPALLQPIAQQGLVAGGYVGFYAHAEGMMRKATKIQAYYEETDCELSVTARTRDGTSSGWSGQAARQWERIDPAAVTARAIDLAQRGINPKAVEPGRRTAILTREAVAQIVRYFAEFYDADATENENTPFWKPGYPANRVNEQVFDTRISMRSDPADRDGGFKPYFAGFTAGDGNATPALDWVKNGVLTNLAFTSPFEATGRGKPYSDVPLSMRVSGGETTIDQMIANCKEGIFVNHFSGVDCVDLKTGLMTGTTRDGCFLIKDGKIETPVKNFRFIDSPMFMLNNLIALGESQRAAYGYTPQGANEGFYYGEWPRRPMIVPPMMIRDFNFTSLSDAI